jgi:hypothetical protein
MDAFIQRERKQRLSRLICLAVHHSGHHSIPIGARLTALTRCRTMRCTERVVSTNMSSAKNYRILPVRCPACKCKWRTLAPTNPGLLRCPECGSGWRHVASLSTIKAVLTRRQRILTVLREISTVVRLPSDLGVD